MPIPESQLETWSHQGAVAGSKSTYAIVKNALESATTAYAGKSYKVFLQGSYGNDTNIWSESDVDVIIRLDSCFHSDLSELTANEKAAWRSSYSNATYCQIEFKRDVLAALNAAFPNCVNAGDKAIAIKADGNRRKADVLPATAYRRYYKFSGMYDQSYDEGICFWDKSGARIANYPNQHCTNLTKKHQSTGNRLKPTIRMMKSLRRKLVEDNLLAAGRAPSYYIEGLMYNVPDAKFSSCLGDTFCNAINWIQQNSDKTTLVTASEQYYLLREDSKTCWNPSDAEAFLKAATDLWNNW